MTAKLDENNFATFFRYTADGMVDLIQRETVRGIFAERESRIHQQEQPSAACGCGRSRGSRWAEGPRRREARRPPPTSCQRSRGRTAT